MPYVHYGRIGDVWKHLPLCSILSIEKPLRYVETNSARAVYALEEPPEQKYGVYFLYAQARKSRILSLSPYVRFLRDLNAEGGSLRTYLGSPGLAMNVLKDISGEFVFFDLEQTALDNIRDYARRIGVLAKVKTIREDSIAGAHRRLDDLSEEDFIHFDPYSIFEPNAGGRSYWDVFLEATRRGIKCMFWYGFFTETERRAVAERFQKTAASFGQSKTNAQLHAVEVFLNSIRPDAVVVNPGVVGCGVLTSNLSSESREMVEALAQGLVDIYKESVFNAHPGKLRSEITIRR